MINSAPETGSLQGNVAMYVQGNSGMQRGIQVGAGHAVVPLTTAAPDTLSGGALALPNAAFVARVPASTLPVQRVTELPHPPVPPPGMSAPIPRSKYEEEALSPPPPGDTEPLVRKDEASGSDSDESNPNDEWDWDNLSTSEKTGVIFGGQKFGCAVFVVALALVGIIYWNSLESKVQQMVTMTRMPTPPAELGECLIWGDPIVGTFDRAEPSFHGEGDFWIIKHPDVKIQGRFLATSESRGLAYLNTIVVSGDFIENHKIVVGPLNAGAPLIDGIPALMKFGSAYFLPNGTGALTYTDKGIVDDKTLADKKKRIITMRFMRSVSVTVFRWQEHIDARIFFPQVPDLDGVCGNFNGVKSDDSTLSVFQRLGPRVPDNESLFTLPLEIQWSTEEQELLMKCTPPRRKKARESCMEDYTLVEGPTPTEAEIKSCMLDVCIKSSENPVIFDRHIHSGKEDDDPAASAPAARAAPALHPPAPVPLPSVAVDPAPAPTVVPAATLAPLAPAAPATLAPAAPLAPMEPLAPVGPAAPASEKAAPAEPASTASPAATTLAPSRTTVPGALEM